MLICTVPTYSRPSLEWKENLGLISISYVVSSMSIYKEKEQSCVHQLMYKGCSIGGLHTQFVGSFPFGRESSPCDGNKHLDRRIQTSGSCYYGIYVLPADHQIPICIRIKKGQIQMREAFEVNVILQGKSVAREIPNDPKALARELRKQEE